jgi:hypothetical protein
MNDFTHFARTSATTHTLFTVAQCQTCGCKIRNTDYEEAGMIEGVTDESLVAIGLEDGSDVARPHGSICTYCNEAEMHHDMMDTGMDETERRYWQSQEMEDSNEGMGGDMDDDREALASAGHGMDEDYGGDRDEGDFG